MSTFAAHPRLTCLYFFGRGLLQMTLEDGAMIEPLSVGVHAVSNLAKVKAGQIVAVFGAGPVGLLSMAVAKGQSCSAFVSSRTASSKNPRIDRLALLHTHDTALGAAQVIAIGMLPVPHDSSSHLSSI